MRHEEIFRILVDGARASPRYGPTPPPGWVAGQVPIPPPWWVPGGTGQGGADQGVAGQGGAG